MRNYNIYVSGLRFHRCCPRGRLFPLRRPNLSKLSPSAQHFGRFSHKHTLPYSSVTFTSSSRYTPSAVICCSPLRPSTSSLSAPPSLQKGRTYPRNPIRTGERHLDGWLLLHLDHSSTSLEAEGLLGGSIAHKDYEMGFLLYSLANP